MLVGMFDGIRAGRGLMDAAEINQQLRVLVGDSKFADRITPRVLADVDVAAVRRLRNSLLARWAAVERGNALELEFNRSVDE